MQHDFLKESKDALLKLRDKQLFEGSIQATALAREKKRIEVAYENQRKFGSKLLPVLEEELAGQHLVDFPATAKDEKLEEKIRFPVKPYSVQKDYIQTLSTAILNSENALLESPTGTGKTLSLLTGALATARRIKQQSGIQPQIIYASRTFTQLNQVMKELKRTAYVPKCVILGSRDKLCVNEEMTSGERPLRGQALNASCKNTKSGCKFFSTLNSMKGSSSLLVQEAMDIEDLHTISKEREVCPFYMNRDEQYSAHIVMIPYNYLLEPTMREVMKVKLKDAIVIIDEAHNISSSCEDAMSIEISTADLDKIEEEITQVIRCMDKVEVDYALDSDDERGWKPASRPDVVQAILKLVTNFKTTLNNVDYSKVDQPSLAELVVGNDPVLSKYVPPNRYFQELSSKSWFLSSKRLAPFMEQFKLGTGLDGAPHAIFMNKSKCADAIEKLLLDISTLRKGAEAFFQKLADLLMSVGSFSKAPDEAEAPSSSTIRSTMMIYDQQGEWKPKPLFFARDTKPKSKILSLKCFDPSICMANIMAEKPRSLILTSGTLSPFDLLEQDLGVEFKHKLQCEHVIKPSQVSIQTLSRSSASGTQFNFVAKNKDNEQMITGLAETIDTLAEKAGSNSGVLVFFSSYSVLASCKKIWDRRGQYFCKNIRYEDKNPDKMAAIFKAHQASCKPGGRGGILAGVCRARLSEGIDFKDDQARVVIIVGVPLPAMGDPYVIIKSQLAAVKGKSSNTFAWHQKQALRAVNQAIGRVIRHKDDYGSIVLVDSRYDRADHKRQISGWLRNLIKTTESGEEAGANVEKLMRANEGGGKDESIGHSSDVSEILIEYRTEAEDKRIEAQAKLEVEKSIRENVPQNQPKKLEVSDSSLSVSSAEAQAKPAQPQGGGLAAMINQITEAMSSHSSRSNSKPNEEGSAPAGSEKKEDEEGQEDEENAPVQKKGGLFGIEDEEMNSESSASQGEANGSGDESESSSLWHSHHSKEANPEEVVTAIIPDVPEAPVKDVPPAPKPTFGKATGETNLGFLSNESSPEAPKAAAHSPPSPSEVTKQALNSGVSPLLNATSPPKVDEQEDVIINPEEEEPVSRSSEVKPSSKPGSRGASPEKSANQPSPKKQKASKPAKRAKTSSAETPQESTAKAVPEQEEEKQAPQKKESKPKKRSKTRAESHEIVVVPESSQEKTPPSGDLSKKKAKAKADEKSMKGKSMKDQPKSKSKDKSKLKSKEKKNEQVPPEKLSKQSKRLEKSKRETADKPTSPESKTHQDKKKSKKDKSQKERKSSSDHGDTNMKSAKEAQLNSKDARAAEQKPKRGTKPSKPIVIDSRSATPISNHEKKKMRKEKKKAKGSADLEIIPKHNQKVDKGGKSEKPEKAHKAAKKRDKKAREKARKSLAKKAAKLPEVISLPSSPEKSAVKAGVDKKASKTSSSLESTRITRTTKDLTKQPILSRKVEAGKTKLAVATEPIQIEKKRLGSKRAPDYELKAAGSKQRKKRS